MSEIRPTFKNVPSWEEDANSPLTSSNSTSATYTVSGDYDIYTLISDPSNTGYFKLQLNGDTGDNYDWRADDGTKTTGVDHIQVPRCPTRGQILIVPSSNEISTAHVVGGSYTGEGVGGTNDTVNSPLTSFTLSDSSQRSTTVRVYGMNL